MLTDVQQPTCEDVSPRNDKLQLIQTIEYGIQVDLNFNPEAPQHGQDENGEAGELKAVLSQAERRKLTKKLSKKRKREKSQEMQRQARRQIGNIIQELYERTARFEDYCEKMQVLVQLVYNNDFRDYLDQLIRMRVTYVQKSIWEYTQSILDENPFESSEDHAFYGLMVDYIYERFLQLEDSSRQIQKIINIYLKYAYQKNQNKEEIVYNNLAVNTFNYMIETDDTLKNLLHICEKKLLPSKVLQQQKLQELTSLIDNYDTEHPHDDDDYDTCPNDDHISTGLSEEDDSSLERKRRRKKIKESELTTNEESLARRLEGLLIRQLERGPCRVSEDWLLRMRLRAVKYKMS